MTVQNIFDFLNILCPVNTARSYDNVGLLIGDSKAEVTKALISLDCTLEAIEIAKAEGCNLIISHHPVIFEPIKNLLAGSVPFELAKSGIAVISMHTNLDMADGGVNEWLCKSIGLSNIVPITTDDGFILRGGEIEAISADCFAEKIKQSLGGCVKYVDVVKEIKKVLVCSGAGSDFLETAINENFDAFVSAEVKHRQFLRANNCGISVFDAGHFHTEDIIVEPLCSLLKKEFAEVQFITHHSKIIKNK